MRTLLLWELSCGLTFVQIGTDHSDPDAFPSNVAHGHELHLFLMWVYEQCKIIHAVETSVNFDYF